MPHQPQHLIQHLHHQLFLGHMQPQHLQSLDRMQHPILSKADIVAFAVIFPMTSFDLQIIKEQVLLLMKSLHSCFRMSYSKEKFGQY
jgi:hypothetical protein